MTGKGVMMMANREKVIKGLEICVNRVPGKYDCNECPYEKDGNYCEINLTNDAIALLKEQEAKPVYYETNSMTGLPISHCPSCGEVIRQYAYGDIRKTYYCPYCGQEVKWE